MKHKVWYDEDNKTLMLKVIGEYSSQDARDSGDMYNEQLQGKPYRQLIVDLSQAGKMESRETRKITNDSFKQAKLTAVAYVGANATTRMIAKILMKLGSLNVFTEFFKTESEAIIWLKNRRNSK